MSPPTPFNMQNCLKPIGELKEENSFHEGLNEKVEPQPQDSPSPKRYKIKSPSSRKNAALPPRHSK